MRLSLAAVACVLATSACLPTWANRLAVEAVLVPASIDPTGGTDVSAPFAVFLATVPDNSVITLQPNARYRMEQTLQIVKRRNLTFDGAGATIFATTPGDYTRASVRVTRSSDINFRNLTIKGANPNAGLADAAYQTDKLGQHGFDVLSVDGFSLFNVAVTDTYGDFVRLGTDESEGGWTSRVYIGYSRFERNGRQGVTMTAVRDVVIEASTFDDMRRATFDLEFHHEGYGAEDIVIRYNQIGLGRLMFVAGQGIGPLNRITIEGNQLTGRNLDIRMQSDDGAIRSDWKVINNTATEVSGNPSLATMQFGQVDGLEVHGNYQRVDTWRPMVGAGVTNACNIDVSGNDFPGAVAESRVTGTC